MAKVYCAFVGKHLPSEAEWEFAARGPEGRAYPWGDEEPTAEHVNACGAECGRWFKADKLGGAAALGGDDGFVGTAPAGSFIRGRSYYGLDDLAGNVWEWTSDWSGPYLDATQSDPSDPAQGTRRVLRGGGFNSGQVKWLRSSWRWSDAEDTKSHANGFRCARSPH